MQRDDDNLTAPKTSNSERQLEKRQLEQRTAEIEVSGGMFMPPPAVGVAPEDAQESRKKALPSPFFRWAAGTAKDSNNLGSGKKKEGVRKKLKGRIF
jgi:hypothetical protein